MGEGVLTPTGLLTNSNTSMAPSKVTITFDRRTVPGDNEKLASTEIMQILNKIDSNAYSLKIEEPEVTTYTGKKITCKKIFQPWVLDKDHQLVHFLINSLKKNNISIELGYWPFCTNGVESMGNRNINTIGFGPGNEELAHTTDEYVEVQQLIYACKVYQELINIIDNN